ncbi:MAG: rod shape-determining protein MreC [Gammaproteobacteria bacterium]|nr:rod shape-determining protein MreC [Gammaproteobacteria bacterium]
MALRRDKRFNAATVLASLIFVSLTLVVVDLNGRFLHTPRQVATWVTNGLYAIVNTPSRWIERSSLYFQDRQRLLDRYDNRESEIQDLAVQVQRTEAIHAENSELRQLLALTQHETELAFVPAELSAVNSRAGRNEIVINRGQTHGVRDGMAVIDSSGVYGQIVEALPYTSRVILITDQRLPVPVRVARTGLNAVAVGVGNSTELVLEHADITADIQVGDQMIASGLGGIYPVGYPVGVVTAIEPDAAGVEARVTVEPSATMHRRNWLLVVTSGSTNEVAQE